MHSRSLFLLTRCKIEWFRLFGVELQLRLCRVEDCVIDTIRPIFEVLSRISIKRDFRNKKELSSALRMQQKCKLIKEAFWIMIVNNRHFLSYCRHLCKSHADECPSAFRISSNLLSVHWIDPQGTLAFLSLLAVSRCGRFRSPSEQELKAKSESFLGDKAHGFWIGF